MARVAVGIIMLIGSLLITVHARTQPAEEEEEAAMFQNICSGKEKLVKIQLYLQDILGGPNQTVYEVARANITSSSPTSFGQVRVLDDWVTAEPAINSTKLGRCQGLIISSDLQIPTLSMNLNFVFTYGEYNGSTIQVLGRNPFNDEIRELAVVGGTGVFRFARGYVITNDVPYDEPPNYAVYEYTIYTTYVPKPSVRPYADM